MKYNFRKILSAITSAVMITSTVGLAAAANYPAPFVSNGVANVAVVYGANAALTDVAAVTDITSSLQAQVASAAAVNATTNAPSTVTGGDYVLLARDSSKLHLGENTTDSFGTATLSSDNLKTLLADGTYLNDANSDFKYEQRIYLYPMTLQYFADSDYNSKTPSVGFKIYSPFNYIMNYTLDFLTDAQSVVGSGSDCASGDLCDIETTTIPLLGKSYYVSKALNNSGSNIKLTLLDSANTATVSEGETQTVNVGSKPYQVKIDSASLKACSGTTKVKLIVNGEETNSLGLGESYKMADGTYVGIKDISCRDVAGTVGSVEFSLGSGKLELNGDDNSVKLNDQSVDDLQAYIFRGTPTSGKQTIDKIIIQWKATEKEFLAPGTDLVMPGLGAVKFSADAFVIPAPETTTVDHGDKYIQVQMPIKDGTASFKILSTNASGEYKKIGGDGDDESLFTSASNQMVINATSGGTGYFIVSYNETKEAVSYLLSATVTESDNYNRTTIKNKVTGDTVCDSKRAADLCQIGRASFTVSEVNYSKADLQKYVKITAGSNTNFDTMFSTGGLKLQLPYIANVENDTDPGAVNFTDKNTLSAVTGGHNANSVALFFYEENKDGNLGDGNMFNVTADDYSDKATISSIDTGQANYEPVGETSDNLVSRVSSPLATLVHLIVSDSRGRAEITYSGAEAYMPVYLTAPSATVTGVSNVGVVSVKDSEVASVAGKNLIVVGGSCVNTVAAELLGSATPLCGADFTAATGVAAGQYLIKSFNRAGTVATLVAGYNAGDTTNAATALTTQTIDTSVGKAYTGTTATSITPVTTAA